MLSRIAHGTQIFVWQKHLAATSPLTAIVGRTHKRFAFLDSHTRMTSSLAKVSSLDHLVLTVRDLPATVRFYESVLGTAHVSFRGGDGEERHALVFGRQKINLHVSGQEFEPKAAHVQPGSADLCFIIEDPVEDVARRLRERAQQADEGVQLVDGGEVVDRTGAKSKLRSVYIRDPDGNLIELSNEVA